MPGIRPNFQRFSSKDSSPSQQEMVAFLNACAQGDLGGVTKFLNVYPRQTGVHRAGKGGLMYAAEHGHNEVVAALLDRGANIHAKDEAGYSALSYAVAGDHHETVLFLLSKKAATGVMNSKGMTLLHLAAANGCGQVMDLLCDLPLDAIDYDCMTALSHAVRGGHEAVVRSLLDRGAALPMTIDGEFTLDFARRAGFGAIASMLKDEPERRRIRQEKEIDTAMSDGTSGATRIKNPVRLLKEPRKQEPLKNVFPGGSLGAHLAAHIPPLDARARAATRSCLPFS